MAEPNEHGRATDGEEDDRSRPAPLLEISSTVKDAVAQDYITIDGEPYDFINLEALSIRERTVLTELIKRIVALWEQGSNGDLNETEQNELRSRMRKVVRFALPSLNAATLRKISDRAVEDIAGCFLLSTFERMPYPLATMVRLQKFGGRMSSLGSSGSTAETRSGG